MNAFHVSPSMRASKSVAATLACAVALLAGCSPKASTCADEATVSVVKKVYQEAMETVLVAAPDALTARAQIASSTSVDVQSIRTVAKDEKIGQVTCEASLSVKVPSEVAKALAMPGNLLSAAVQQMEVKVSGDRLEKEIKYTSQITDDGKEVRVATEGTPEMGQLIATLAMTGLFKPATPAAVAPQAAVAPAPASAGTGEPPAAPAVVAKPAATTRYGAVTITEDLNVLFQGKPLSPPIQGDNELSVKEKFEVGADDVLLLEQVGGTGCPAQYYFVRVNSAGATGTPSFGTCSDEIKTQRDGERISVVISGFAGNLSQAEQDAAAKERRTFVYQAGAVAEPGGKAAANAAKPSFSCASKLSASEQLICSTPSLSEADAKLGLLYSSAAAKAPDAAALKQQQREWRASRDACPDEACIQASYAKRIAELSR